MYNQKYGNKFSAYIISWIIVCWSKTQCLAWCSW